MKTNNILKALDQFEKIANSSLKKLAQQPVSPVDPEFQNYINYVLGKSNIIVDGRRRIDVDGRFGPVSREAMKKIIDMYIGYNWDKQNLNSDTNLDSLKKLFQDLRSSGQEIKTKQDLDRQNSIIQKDIASIDQLLLLILDGAQQTNPNLLFKTISNLKNSFDKLLQQMRNSVEYFNNKPNQKEKYLQIVNFSQIANDAFKDIYNQYAKDGRNPLGRANFARVTAPLNNAMDILKNINKN